MAPPRLFWVWLLVAGTQAPGIPSDGDLEVPGDSPGFRRERW
ncbi:LGALS3BP isoform 16 [Pongo abelii]|uniref:LGALS3BP isoform 14 n=1 Tax=Pongo abelii TaxID=9601 RepID=A0A2J8Y1Y9_PONAB|nr:LGALS3BP isoform 14 [Pongo abelii]PNJ88308.1 LGALS3BP isoform 16 [Pongo abelii]